MPKLQSSFAQGSVQFILMSTNVNLDCIVQFFPLRTQPWARFLPEWSECRGPRTAFHHLSSFQHVLYKTLQNRQWHAIRCNNYDFHFKGVQTTGSCACCISTFMPLECHHFAYLKKKFLLYMLRFQSSAKRPAYNIMHPAWSDFADVALEWSGKILYIAESELVLTLNGLVAIYLAQKCAARLEYWHLSCKRHTSTQ